MKVLFPHFFLMAVHYARFISYQTNSFSYTGKRHNTLFILNEVLHFVYASPITGFLRTFIINCYLKLNMKLMLEDKFYTLFFKIFAPM